MDLGLVTETWGADDQTWLGSRHGTGNAVSATLAFSGAQPFVKANYEEVDTYKGFVPSGTALARRADGKYVPFVSGGTGDQAVLAGFLLAPVKLPAGNDAVGALLDHGRIRFSRLPSGQTLGADAAALRVSAKAGSGVFVIEA